MGLVERCLPADRRAHAEAHLAGCGSCRSWWAALAIDAPPSGGGAGRYELRRLIGRGATSEVFVAWDPLLAREIALKLFNEGEVDVRRIRREVRALARVQHPHVLAAYDAGEEAGRAFVATELCAGGSLARFVGAPVEPERARRWLEQACLGLRELARHGLVHRDLKPSNLLLDDEDRIKVADLGLVTRVEAADDRALTRTGQLLGTPLYMSPEQARGAPVDLRADLYALGATFYHLLAGRTPWPADEAVALVLTRRLTEEPRPLREIAPHVPEDLATIVDDMIRRDPEARMADYDEALARLAGAPRRQRAALDRGARDVRPLARLLRAGVRSRSASCRRPGSAAELHLELARELTRAGATAQSMAALGSLWRLGNVQILVQAAADPEGAQARVTAKTPGLARLLWYAVAMGFCLFFVSGKVEDLVVALGGGAAGGWVRAAGTAIVAAGGALLLRWRAGRALDRAVEIARLPALSNGAARAERGS